MKRRSEAIRPVFIFDTSVLIDYLHDQELAADAFIRASEMGEVRLTIISLLELYLPKEEWVRGNNGEKKRIVRTRSKAEINDDFKKIKHLQKLYRLQIMQIPEKIQRYARDEIARHHYSPLGKNLISDSLILACGFLENAWLVARDEKWFRLVRRRRRPLRLRLVHPARLVQAATLEDLLEEERR